MPSSQVIATASAALLLGALPLAIAHGDDQIQPEHGHGAVVKHAGVKDSANYFRHPEYAGWMYTHIVLMIVSWVFLLPPSIMLSIARSRWHLPAQFTFHATNSFGLFTGFIYNQSTPDLYVTNSHHPVGWAVTAIAIIWTLLSAGSAFAAHRKQRKAAPSPPPTLTLGVHHSELFQPYVDSPTIDRFSSDSGNFSAGSRADSSDSTFTKSNSPMEDGDDAGTDSDSEKLGFLGNNKADHFLSRALQNVSGTPISSVVRISQIVLEKFLLLLGFLAIASGFVVYGGLFQGREIFSGLAHFVKGGIFFFYGLLTLGRWMGAFAEFGWAWNVRPRSPLISKWRTRIPSAEFTESFVIWLYGASNVFLEHLTNWGGSWSPQDFEHVSITILFFGGGLLGMIVESKLVGDSVSLPVLLPGAREMEAVADESGFTEISPHHNRGHEHEERPATYKFSFNPMPALTIMFLGIMMSGHKQTSMVSTMMHAKWGMLFTGFSLARIVTYLMLYIKPPTSHFPSRPPSELVAAFCLTSGGILFMNSAHDSIRAIESNGLDAMAIFTITIGITGIIMAWEVACLALKNWAARREERAARV